jgi:hypothetical protein
VVLGLVENKEQSEGSIKANDVIRQLRATQLKVTMKKSRLRHKHTSLHVTRSHTHLSGQKQHPHHHQLNSASNSDPMKQSSDSRVVSNNISSNKRSAEQTLPITKRHRSEGKSNISTCDELVVENEKVKMSKNKTNAESSNAEFITDTVRKFTKVSPHLRDAQRHKQVAAARRRLSEMRKKENEDGDERFNTAEQQRRKTVTHPLLEALVQHNRRIHSVPSRDNTWKTSTLIPFKPIPLPFFFHHPTKSQQHSIVTSNVRDSSASSLPHSPVFTSQHITHSLPQKNNHQSSGTLENPVELLSESEEESEEEEEEEKETSSSDCSGPATPSTSPRSETNTSLLSVASVPHTHSVSVVPLLTLNENEVPPLKRTLSRGALITLRLIAFQTPTQSVLLPLTSQHSDFRLLHTCFRFRTSPFGTPQEIALCNVHSIKVSISRVVFVSL